VVDRLQENLGKNTLAKNSLAVGNMRQMKVLKKLGGSLGFSVNLGDNIPTIGSDPTYGGRRRRSIKKRKCRPKKKKTRRRSR